MIVLCDVKTFTILNLYWCLTNIMLFKIMNLIANTKKAFPGPVPVRCEEQMR